MAKPGRKPDEFKLPDGTLQDRLDAVLDAWPELRARFGSRKAIGVAMAPFWHPNGRRGPDDSTISTKMNGNLEVTSRFVKALHSSLPMSTADVAKWLLPVAEFRRFVDLEREESPVNLFKRLADGPAFIGIGVQQHVLGLGRAPSPVRPIIEIRAAQHLTVKLPMPGFLTVINFGADQYGISEHLWLDPALGIVGRRHGADRIVVPDRACGVPVDGPPAVYILIAINTKLTIDMAEVCSASNSLEEPQRLSERTVRNLFFHVASRPGDERAVCILEYEVVDRR